MADLFDVFVEGAAPAAPFCVVELAGAPQGRKDPRARIVFPRAGKPFVHFYQDEATRAYEQALAWKARAAMKGRKILTGPIAVRCFAMIPVPRSWSDRDRDAALAGTIFPTGKPDDDNYLKCRDAFKGIIWNDDAQVCRSLIVKEYAEKPGLIFEIFTII